MTKPDLLQTRFPLLGENLPRVPLASLPTPVSALHLDGNSGGGSVWIKDDQGTGKTFGGNKVRKLEYLFGRIDRNRVQRVATYGTVASNHALATALYATRLSLESTCFLAHQTRTELARIALNMHLVNATELVPFGGRYGERLRAQREHLWNRRAAVIPAGGSSWTGTAGFVNAGLEIADQVDAGELPCPQRIYIAAGTMGSAAGLAIGLAVAGLAAEVEAVRVSHRFVCNEEGLARLMQKTCLMLNRIDATFPLDAWRRARVNLRHEFFGPGYAKPGPETSVAIATIAAQSGLRLEATYTGKAMAALLADFEGCRNRGERQLFWNTFHAGALPVGTAEPVDRNRLPAEFCSYFD